MNSLLKHFCLNAIKMYQASSGLFFRSACRFWPTCSQYAYEAIESRGAARGIALGLRRLLRCRPAGGRGYDPVP